MTDLIKMTTHFKALCFLMTMLMEYTQQNEAIPQFWLLPDPEIYEDETVRDVRIQVVVSPVNTTLLLGVLTIGSGGNADEIKLLDFGSFTSSLSSDNVRVIVESKEVIGTAKHKEKWLLKIVRYQSVFEKSLHILAKNSIGTVTSRPFKIRRKVLNPFPLVHHESAEFLMGNVGQVVCMIPHSKPSPPNIEFLHDNILVNTTKGSRYKKVYLTSGAMILLIKNIKRDDKGSYSCTASLPHTTSFQKSETITQLSVLEPKSNLKPRFRLSSHSTERGGHSRIIEVLEGLDLTLYCLYESAPVAEVIWYWPNSNRKYEVDNQFGTIFIPNVQKEDASDYSCSVDDIIGRTFSLRVIELPRFTSTPSEISFDDFLNQPLRITCEIQNEISKRNIRWFHNGRILNENVRKIKFLGNVLYIKSLSENNLGIYQCWLENDGSLWATGVTVIKRMKKIESELNSQRENALIIDKRTASGLTIHLECSLSRSQMDKITDFTVKWYRGTDSLEPIDLISTKYVMFNKKSEKKVILSIVNPTKTQDEGIYVCRLYGTKANLLQTIKFRLTIEDQKSNELPNFENNQKKVFAKENLVGAPEVSRVNSYLFAVHLKWKVLLSDKPSIQIYHYRIQYQRKQLQKLLRKESGDDRKSEEWSEEKMIDDYTTNNQITVLERQIFRPYSQLRFRVIVIPKVSSPMPSSRGSNETMIDNLSSEWSKPVEFKNILSCKLSISKNKATASTFVEVMWTHTCVKEPQWQSIVFNIVYVSVTDCIKAKKCQPEYNVKTYESILVLPQYGSLLHSVRIDRDFGEFFQANVTGLKPNSEYAMGIYGKITSMSQEVSFISLSNVINVTTAKTLKLNIKDKENTQIHQSESDDARNRVIFLVLGSLAGVLFVVAAVMFGMCAWYYMKKHMKIHKAQLKPHDPHQPALLFHYPPSSMSSPICYGSRIDPMTPYQASLPNTNSKFMYYTSQKLGNSPMNSCRTKQKELWPVNFFNHSPNTVAIADKFSSEHDSDIDSICNSEKMTHSNIRRNVVMGADQASSTYSRVGSERRLSMGPVNIMSSDYPSNFQNMTLPRHCMIPISFPEPPAEPHQDSFQSMFPQNSDHDHHQLDQQTDIIDENSSSVPFLNCSRGWCNGSMNSLVKKDYTIASRSKFASDNAWMTETYYDPYSSNSSTGNENNQFKSMIQTYT